MSSSGKRARRWIILGGTAAALALASALHPHGLRQARVLADNVVKMREENARLATENAELWREVQALRSDPAAIERAVREEYKYVRPGERVYVLEPPPAAPAGRAAATSAPERAR